jgi:hypothetical protein
MVDKYFIYYIYKNINELYNIKKKYIDVTTKFYLSEVINLNNKYLLEKINKKIYYLELFFKEKIEYFKLEEYKINFNETDNIILFDNSILNVYFYKKNISLKIDFSLFYLNCIINNSIYGYDNEKNSVTIPFEAIEIDWIKEYNIKSWSTIFKYFVKSFDLTLLPFSNFEPIYIRVIQWSYYIRVLCVINNKGYYLIELSRY